MENFFNLSHFFSLAIRELLLPVRIILFLIVLVAAMLSVYLLVVVAVPVLLTVVMPQIVAKRNLFHLQDVKPIMMAVMTVLFLGVMLLLVQSVLVYGKVYHHVLRVRQAILSRVTGVSLLPILV